jgi:hypothetical protein
MGPIARFRESLPPRVVANWAAKALARKLPIWTAEPQVQELNDLDFEKTQSPSGQPADSRRPLFLGTATVELLSLKRLKYQSVAVLRSLRTNSFVERFREYFPYRPRQGAAPTVSI